MPYKKSRSKKFRRKSRKIKRKTLKINRRKSHKIKRRNSRKARGFTKRRTKYTGGASDVSNEKEKFGIKIEPYTGQSDYYTLKLTLTSKSPEISVEVNKQNMDSIIYYLKPLSGQLPPDQLRGLPDNHPARTRKWAKKYLRGHEDFRDKELTSITVTDSIIKLSQLKKLLTIYKDTIRELTLVRTGLTEDAVSGLIGELGIHLDTLIVTKYEKTVELEGLKRLLEINKNDLKGQLLKTKELKKLYLKKKRSGELTDEITGQIFTQKANFDRDIPYIMERIQSFEGEIAKIEAEIEAEKEKELEPGAKGLAKFLNDLENF